jgi:uncharacterized protein (TIGR03790 family)
MLLRIFSAGTLSLMALALALRAAEPGESVVVIYNTRLAESKDVARHYAARRDVPPGQIIGLELPDGETMSRTEYREELQEPLLKFLEKKEMLVYPPLPAGSDKKDVLPIAAKVRYVVLCYGVPLRIGEDPLLVDPGAEKIRQEWRRNGAAVDSELCTLPIKNPSRPLAGPMVNRLYGTQHPSSLNPTNGLLLVARLDGPSAAIARALVDKALEAETDGLWGRAYFDLRSITNAGLKEGDDWIRGASETARRFGFEVVVDNKPETFPAAFPMSQIALYAGWYDANVSGPFARPKVEFMPGAFAYHLHSYSAHTLRSATANWCGPFLAAGATATMGCIDEPYLMATPNVDVFFARWLLGGFSFGEAAYACQQAVSWQTTVIGDPLYRPFGRSPRELHDSLARRHSKLLEWSDLQIVDKGLVLGATPGEMVQFLLSPEAPQDSAVLAEKLAELEDKQGLYESSIKFLRNALNFDPTPQQKVRLTLMLADKLAAAGREGEALALCDDFLKNSPDYPDAIGLYARMEAMANKLHQTRQAEKYARAIAKLNGGK